MENCRRADLEDKTPDQLNIIDYVPHTLRLLWSAELVLIPTVPLTLEEKENKELLKSSFEILIPTGKQNIPLGGHGADEIPEGLFTPDRFQAQLGVPDKFWGRGSEKAL